MPGKSTQVAEAPAPRATAVALARRYSFGDVSALIDANLIELDDSTARRAHYLCEFGQRLFDLDAEDFGVDDSARTGTGVLPPELVRRSRACRMPQAPKEQPRGALGSLRPAYRLLLEVIEARWARREMAALVAAIHIASEYLPLLAWEPVLGHAGDPARIGELMSVDGSLFGVADARGCAHRRNETAAAGRALRVVHEPPQGWRSYLDRQHSHLAHAFAVCAAACREPCAAVTQLPADAYETLRHRCDVVLAVSGSALVRLRHAAPVGHGFGVPSPQEVLQAWEYTKISLAGRSVDLDGDAFPSPALTHLFSIVAGTRLAPDTLIADTAAELASCLSDGAPAEAPTTA